MKDLVVQIGIGINSFYVHFFKSDSHFSNSIQSVLGVRANLSNQGIIILWDFIPRIQVRVGSDSKSTWPGGFRIRTDSHLYSGYKVPQYYDALVAKICSHSKDRLDAIRKMRVALEEMYIEGIDTNTDLHDKIFHEKNFVEGNISINYLKEILNIS